MTDKILLLREYPNLLDQIEFDYVFVEERISDYPLKFSQVRNKKVEWGMRFPIFLESFYDYVLKNQDIPKQLEFFKYYLSSNTVFFSENRLGEGIMEGLKARIYRTYPSLVRDIHFALFLKSKIKRGQVIYNQRLDVEEGIDLIIEHGGRYYAVNLYTDTKRAYAGRDRKNYRHTKYSNVNYLELPVEFRGSKSIGNFFLYAEREMKKLNQLFKSN